MDIKPIYESEKPYKCADYGGECKCPGRVHFGLKKRLDNGEDIKTLEGLMDWMKGEELNKQGGLTKVDCKRNNFKKKDIGKIWK